MKQRPFTIVFTVLVTVAFVAPISFAYLLTKPIVALNEEVFLKRAVLYAAGVPVPAGNEQIVAAFAARAEQSGGADGAPPYYRIKAESGQLAGYVFLRSGPGLWGEITATVGFDGSLERLTGVDFLKQSETPGLGARISEAWFREQFRGKRGPFSTVPEGEPAQDNQFDAITGATLTSNYVKSILNTTVAQAKSLVK
jgi:Na+-transporting NADH:ubiquinone oxidoreductase subunit C